MPTLVLILGFSLCFLGCNTKLTPPYVQSSSKKDPGGNIVPITKEGRFGIPCLETNAGKTVEWRNHAPKTPTNVTSLGDPIELYSPNLQSPYNMDEQDGEAYSYWRHEFVAAGVYEYYDTNKGDPGQKVVDAYYGTVTYVGISDQVETGVVCVNTKGGAQCDGVCCIKNGDCPKSQCCDPTFKRCVLTSSDAPKCEGKPAFREFECFTDSDCPDGKSCSNTNHRCESNESGD